MQSNQGNQSNQNKLLQQDYEIKVVELDEALYEAGLDYLQQSTSKYWTDEQDD